MFTLPEELPATVAELDALRDQAQRSINVIQARHEAGEELTREDAATLRGLLDAVDTIGAARTEAHAAEQAHADEVNALISRATTPAPEAEVEADTEVDADAEADTEVEAEDRELVTAGAAPAKGKAPAAPVTFAAAGADQAPAEPTGPGWEMVPGAPSYRAGKVGFAELALAIDSVTKNSRKARGANAQARGSYFAQPLARLRREVSIVEDSHALVAAIERATNQRNLPGGSLTAAGGWCAPSEQLYDFCDVPEATDLVSVPEITINRGGVRWPIEPDLSDIYDSFQFFFTEPELEAVDGGGVPTAVKECVEIPCPDEFEELRLNAVGYCVEAGILQTQGWPELIEWFMRSLAQEHLRAISRRTILDIVDGSGAERAIASAVTIGATSAVLNSLALMAVNLRLNKGLARNATIEGIAPSWFHEVLRADLAMQEGMDTNAVTDAQISAWLTARGIALQFVGDWQTRSTGLPGNLSTLTWPATVNVILYPAGTWFRAMSNVIELGVMYPKEQLVLNRYTRFFTEDAIAVGKRCNESINVKIPLCVNGGIGERIEIACSSQVPSVTYTATVVGSPTGGSFTLTYAGKTTATIAHNAAASAVKSALVALDDGFSTSDFTVSGSNGGPYTIVTPGGTLTASGAGLTGGSDMGVTIA